MGEPRGWWTLSGDVLMAMMQRAAAGEDPELLYAEMYANSHVEPPEGDQEG